MNVCVLMFDSMVMKKELSIITRNMLMPDLQTEETFYLLQVISLFQNVWGYFFYCGFYIFVRLLGRDVVCDGAYSNKRNASFLGCEVISNELKPPLQTPQPSCRRYIFQCFTPVVQSKNVRNCWVLQSVMRSERRRNQIEIY